MTDATRGDWASAADPTRRVGRRVEFHPTIGSTNDRARQALGEPGGLDLAVVADLQTAGRGRRGRPWISPAGRNLMVSVGLRPRIAALDAWWLAGAAALAVRDACAPWADLGVKWPNDLLAADGRKVAGLLIETGIDGDRVTEAIVGMGINVNWRRAEMPAELADRATSLAEVVGTGVDRLALLRRLLDALAGEVEALEAGIAPLERYRAASAIDGRQIAVTVADGRLDGRVAGIGDDGSLLLDTPHGRVAVAHGEVERIEAADEVPA